MKKKLEAELISIAHRILKIKNKDDVRELHYQTQKLYEKLSVLLFVEEHFSDVKPTLNINEIEVHLEKIFNDDEKKEVNAIQPEGFLDEPESIITPSFEVDKNVVFDAPKDDVKQVTIEDILENVKTEPLFDKIDDIQNESISPEIAKIIEDKVEDTKADTKYVDIPQVQEFVFDKVDTETIASNLNDKLKKSINIGLNDRLAFEQHLFAGSSEDYNRVISQLTTFDNVTDATTFINEMIKPDYNNWEGKDEFAQRFIEIVENKFI